MNLTPEEKKYIVLLLVFKKALYKFKYFNFLFEYLWVFFIHNNHTVYAYIL